MTNCIEEGTLQAYIDGELLPSELERVQSHLGGCAACSARADDLRATGSHIGSLLAAYAGPPDPRTALAAAMRSISPVPATHARISSASPSGLPAAVSPRAAPRRGWGLAMAGFGVAAAMLLAFWVSGMFQAASSPAESPQINGVPADPVSRPAGVGTPENLSETLKSFVPQGKVRHLVFEEVEEGTSRQKVIEEVWLTNGVDHPLLYRAVSPYGSWQLVGKDAVWTYLGERPAVQGRITRLVDGSASDRVIFKTSYDLLHFDRYVASDESVNNILAMPRADTAAATIDGRAVTVLEYDRDNALRTWPNAGRTPIVGFSSLSTDADTLLGWQPRLSAQDPNSGLTFRVAPSTPEVVYLPPFPTPTASPALRVDIPPGGWQVTGPEIVSCQVWLDSNTRQVLQQTTTRRLSGFRIGDNGTPVAVEQIITESRKLVVDELLDPSEMRLGVFDLAVPEGYRVLELGYTFARPVPAEPTPAFVPTVTPIPYP
jgi:hypothetical protein